MSEIFNIVQSKAEHLNGIYEIEKSSFSVPWSKNALFSDIQSNILAHYVTALKDEKPVGYGGMWLVEDEAHITNIAVHKDYRKLGCGYEILNALIKKCKDAGIKYMSLEVRVSNIGARHLYEKLGFNVEGIRKNYYSDNQEDAYVMWKYL